MLAAQGGGCAICEPRPEERTLHVDHDHETGAIRGLLCFRCNNALGDFRRRSPSSFHAAADYLERDDELVAAAKARALARIGLTEQRRGSGAPVGSAADVGSPSCRSSRPGSIRALRSPICCARSRRTSSRAPAARRDGRRRPLEVAHGTTVLAIRFADGVVMAGDRRATAGYTIANRRIEKVFAGRRLLRRRDRRRGRARRSSW